MQEAIQVVITSNAIEVRDDDALGDEVDTDLQNVPLDMDHQRAYSAPRSPNAPEWDWAGITGKWRRLVAFGTSRRDVRDELIAQLTIPTT